MGDQYPEVSLSPGAAPDHVRVWYRWSDTNEISYWDFALTPGMLMRDLRVLVSHKSKKNIFMHGFMDLNAQLLPLDQPVEGGQGVLLALGPQDDAHVFGPFITAADITCMVLREVAAAVLPIGLLAVLNVPMENVYCRMTSIALNEGVRLSAMQVIRRVSREEGLASLWRSGAFQFGIVTVNILGNLTLALIIPQDSGMRLVSLSLTLLSHSLTSLSLSLLSFLLASGLFLLPFTNSLSLSLCIL